MRTTLGIVAGIVIALVVQSAGDLFGNWMYPPPISDMLDRAQITAAFAVRPAPALWLGAVSYFLGGLVGGGLGKMIAGRKIAAWFPPGALALMALVIAFNFPIPIWAMFATFAAPLVGGMIANHLVKERGAAAAGAAADV